MKSPLLHKQEVYNIVNCALEVHNALGPGLHEKPYENALAVEFGLREIPYNQQERFPVWYKSVQVAEYIPDLIAYGKIEVDTKVIDRIGDHEMGQMLNYLRITELRVGLILNFKPTKLEWKRVIL